MDPPQTQLVVASESTIPVTESPVTFPEEFDSALNEFLKEYFRMGRVPPADQRAITDRLRRDVIYTLHFLWTLAESPDISNYPYSFRTYIRTHCPTSQGEEGSRKRLKTSGIGFSVNAAEPSELVEQISLRLGCIEQSQQATVKKLEELLLQLDSSSSSMSDGQITNEFQYKELHASLREFTYAH